jgi:hypothetical protein
MLNFLFENRQHHHHQQSRTLLHRHLHHQRQLDTQQLQTD